MCYFFFAFSPPCLLGCINRISNSPPKSAKEISKYRLTHCKWFKTRTSCKCFFKYHKGKIHFLWNIVKLQETLAGWNRYNPEDFHPTNNGYKYLLNADTFINDPSSYLSFHCWWHHKLHVKKTFLSMFSSWINCWVRLCVQQVVYLTVLIKIITRLQITLTWYPSFYLSQNI